MISDKSWSFKALYEWREGIQEYFEYFSFYEKLTAQLWEMKNIYDLYEISVIFSFNQP